MIAITLSIYIKWQAKLENKGGRRWPLCNEGMVRQRKHTQSSITYSSKMTLLHKGTQPLAVSQLYKQVQTRSGSHKEAEFLVTQLNRLTVAVMRYTQSLSRSCFCRLSCMSLVMCDGFPSPAQVAARPPQHSVYGQYTYQQNPDDRSYGIRLNYSRSDLKGWTP